MSQDYDKPKVDVFALRVTKNDEHASHSVKIVSGSYVQRPLRHNKNSTFIFKTGTDSEKKIDCNNFSHYQVLRLLSS